jgi:class 3 adenylate cyclase
VILAARIASQALGGEILVSSLLKALVDSAGDISWGESRSVELKGLSGTHEIWPVTWEV